MNKLETGFALGIAYALGRRHGTKTAGRVPAGDPDPSLERLRTEARAYLLTRAQPLFASLGRGLGRVSVRFTGIAEGDSPALRRLALAVGRRVTRGGARPLPAAARDDEREQAPLELEEGSGS
jgi:hypothetical protein